MTKSFIRWYVRLLACVLLASFGVVMPVACAFAEEAEAAPSGSQSSELSDDGKDYGKYYRQGDYLFLIEGLTSNDWRTKGEKWGIEGDRVYTPASVRTGSYQGRSPNSRICENWYGDVLDYNIDGGLDVDVVINCETPGSCTTWGPSALGEPNHFPKIKLIEYGHRTASDLRRVVFDKSIVGYWSPGPDGTQSDKNPLTYLDRWFEDCVNLYEIKGLQYLSTRDAKSMSRMFANCSSLQQLDLSSFDTSSCTNMGGMFDGCTSLGVLTLGEGWTQAATEVSADASSLGPDSDAGGQEPRDEDDASRKATFPVDMCVIRDGERVVYHAGEVIPDGAQTYTAVGHGGVLGLTMSVMGPDGTMTSDSSQLVFPYTGSPIEPTVVLSSGDTVYTNGQDYTVTYVDNIQDGTAQVRVKGQGILFGERTMTFTIEDRAAWGLLYEDGLLYLKERHERPNRAIISAERELVATVRWLDADGTVITPLHEQAAAATHIMIDSSLKSFTPTSADEWFSGLTELKAVEGWEKLDAGSLTSMRGLFRGCTGLLSLDLSALKMSKVQDISEMFEGCTSLEELNFGSANLTAVVSSEGIFEGCTSLSTIRCGYGWRNSATAPVSLDRPALRISPSYERLPQGTALPNTEGTYRTGNLPLQLTNVEIPEPTYVCTGKPIAPKPIVRLGTLELVEGVDYQVTYANNVLPGTARVTLTGTGIMSGELEVPFTIVAGATQVGDRLSYSEGGVTYTMVVTSVVGKGWVASATLTQVSVEDTGINELALPTQCTLGNIKVTVTAVSSKLRGNFRNVSTVTIGPKVTSIGARAFSRAPKVKRLVVKSSRLRTVKNCLTGSRVTSVSVRVRLTKSLRNKYKSWFTTGSGKRGIRYTYSG